MCCCQFHAQGYAQFTYQGLFSAAMDEDIELFKEMRHVKSKKGQMDELAETVDKVALEQRVANTFAKIFDTLYNSLDSEQGMTESQDRIPGLVQTKNSLEEVNKLTAEFVKQAAVTLKPHKMNVFQGCASDALLHARTISIVSSPWSLGAGCCTALSPG